MTGPGEPVETGGRDVRERDVPGRQQLVDGGTDLHSLQNNEHSRALATWDEFPKVARHRLLVMSDKHAPVIGRCFQDVWIGNS